MKPDPKSHPNAEVVDVLRRTLDLLAGPDKKGSALAKIEESHSFTASGIGCEAWDETAAKWSIIGALAKFTMPVLPWNVTPVPGAGSTLNPPGIRLRKEILFDDSFRYLLAAAIMERPQTVNGVNNRGWDAVRDLIELAILLAEQDARILPALILPNGGVPSPELRKRLERIALMGKAGVQVPS
jgi:hypothetical protein